MNILTIIIPMFNEQENIEKCVKALKQQTNQNFDVIFIDDGSVDCTKEILKKCLVDDVEFESKIIEQKNKGAAEARRAGTKKSETDYILFFDCDDILSNDMVDEVYRIYNENQDVDMIIPNMFIQKKNKEWEEFVFYTKDKVLSSSDCLLASIDGWQVHGCFTVKKEIILKSHDEYLEYNKNNENYINNDEVITRLNFSNSKKVVRCNGIYYYNYNDSSTTKKINSKKYLMINNALILYDLYSKDSKINSAVKAELVSSIWRNFRYTYRYKKQLSSFEESIEQTSHAIDKIAYLNFFPDIVIKKKIQLSILKIVNLFWVNNEK